MSYDDHISSVGTHTDRTCNRAVKLLELKHELEEVKGQYVTLMDRLSDSERWVIRYTLDGLSKRDIAQIMCYSVDNIYKIYNVAICKLHY